MKIYRVVFTATVGEAYIAAPSEKEASARLGAANEDGGQDTQYVIYNHWDPELLDLDDDAFEEVKLKNLDDSIGRKLLSPQEELYLAVKNLQENWDKNLTSPMTMVNMAMARIEKG